MAAALAVRTVRRLLALALPAVLLAPAPAGAQGPPIEVQVNSGRIAGIPPDGGDSFKGAPYAAPPTGPLRWRPPAPPAAWNGVRPADRFGAVCMQKPSRDNGVGPGPASEDCLTLNVTAPAGAEGRLALP
jgi:para-nitrobenzyl esterase